VEWLPGWLVGWLHLGFALLAGQGGLLTVVFLQVAKVQKGQTREKAFQL
jgi:hypothetical protein